MGFLRRQATMLIATIANGAAISDELDITDFSGGIVITPAAWTAANIGIKVAEKGGGTFAILRGVTGTAVQISGVLTTASRAYVLPDEVFACGSIKLWSKNVAAATETDNNQGAERLINVLLKS